jgi:3-carboxy-cis,cis-muconate cycloisomerase
MGTTLDHEPFADLFGTAQMRALFSGKATLQAWLDVETALAQAQADVGEIPQAAAQRITDEAKAERFDLRELATQILVTGHPLVPLVRELASAALPAGRTDASGKLISAAASRRASCAPRSSSDPWPRRGPSAWR